MRAAGQICGFPIDVLSLHPRPHPMAALYNSDIGGVACETQCILWLCDFWFAKGEQTESAVIFKNAALYT